MKTVVAAFAGLLFVHARIAGAEPDISGPPAQAEAQVEILSASPDSPAGVAPQPVQPPAQEPMQAPPPPPAQPPPPPVEAVQPQQQAQVVAPVPAPEASQQMMAGHWVYTAQYGWVWMPYGTQYTYEGAASNTTEPYSYVYYPAYGWTWVVAPWVWGWGAYP
ncbi:MAG: hypothetical protein ABJA82_18065, partial [Myxococcales bacterium]